MVKFEFEMSEVDARILMDVLNDEVGRLKGWAVVEASTGYEHLVSSISEGAKKLEGLIATLVQGSKYL